jgi:hypothetical protein
MPAVSLADFKDNVSKERMDTYFCKKDLEDVLLETWPENELGDFRIKVQVF